MKKHRQTSRGASFVTAVFTLLLFSVLAGAFASLIRRQAIGSTEFTVDEQVIFLADSGIEMAFGWLYKDDATKFSWWDNSDPADKTRLLPYYSNISLAGGTVTVSCQYAATLLTNDIGSADSSITVDSTAGFPDTGIVLINTEWIQYFSKTPTQFLGCIRGYSTSDPDSHTGGTFVYPASQLSANITNTDTVISVTSTEKFLPEGTLFIESEAIRYKSKTSTQFLGCQRGSFATTAVLHSQNEKVFPAQYEAHITSTALKNGRTKTVQALLQYQYGSKWK